MAEVELEEFIDGLHVQIGSHVHDLSRRNGPYHRWPNVVVMREATAKVTQIASPFGGIVYLGCHLPPEGVAPSKFNVTATFRGLCRHPIASTENPQLWEETKDLDVPWGEIVIGPLTFPLPTNVMREIGDFAPLFARYTTALQELTRFLGPRTSNHYRVVFDVDLLDPPSPGYPLVYRVDAIDRMLKTTNGVSGEFFSLCSFLALLTLEECFDLATEIALGAVTASVICGSLFPEFDPLSLADLSLPSLFRELWEIHRCVDNTIISKTVAAFQNPEFKVSLVLEDMWIVFVKELSRQGQTNFSKFLDRARPIPLIVMASLQDLPEYQPSS